MRIGDESPRFEFAPALSVARAAAPPKAGDSGAFLQALKGVGGAVDQGEALITRAAQGNLGGLDSSQLIALQAGIYRYSEAVDLVAKLVDRATNAVRSVLAPQ